MEALAWIHGTGVPVGLLVGPEAKGMDPPAVLCQIAASPSLLR